MPGSTSKAALFLSCAAGALAQSLATCEGFRVPDWDDCQAIYDQLEGRVGVFELDPSFYPDCSTIGFSQAGWNSNDYNCAVTVCPMVENPRILYSDIRTGISTVKAVCEHTNTGGQDVYDDQFVIEVMSNPDYDTSPVTIGSVPDNNGKREAGEERLHQRDFVTKRQSPNDDNSPLSVKQTRVPKSGSEPTTGASKRQSPDDDSFTLLVKQSRVQKPNSELPVSGKLTSGSSVELSEETSTTTGVSISADVSAGLFEIFEASIGTEVSREQTSTSAVGTTIVVDCNSGQQGVIYWYPLYTLYQGKYEPSGDSVDFWIPDDSLEGTSSFGVTCLG